MCALGWNEKTEGGTPLHQKQISPSRLKLYPLNNGIISDMLRKKASGAEGRKRKKLKRQQKVQCIFGKLS